MADPKATSGKTVSVACKLPHGLVLRVFNMVERDEPVMGGGFRKARMAEERAERFVVHGFSHAQNAAPHCTIVAGYAITSGIPEEHWDLWLSQNKNSDMVRNGLIFAQNSTASITDNAKDGHKIKSGLERLDPTKLPKALSTSDMMNADLARQIAVQA